MRLLPLLVGSALFASAAAQVPAGPPDVPVDRIETAATGYVFGDACTLRPEFYDWPGFATFPDPSEFACGYTRPGRASYNPLNPLEPQAVLAINSIDLDLTYMRMWVGYLRLEPGQRLRFSLRTSRDFSDYSPFPQYDGHDFQIWVRYVGEPDSLLIYSRDQHTNGQPRMLSFEATLDADRDFVLTFNVWDPTRTHGATFVDLSELWQFRSPTFRERRGRTGARRAGAPAVPKPGDRGRAGPARRSGGGRAVVGL